MTAQTHKVSAKRERFAKKRPYVHAKKRASKVKSSKNYLKVYRGQGRH